VVGTTQWRWWFFEVVQRLKLDLIKIEIRSQDAETLHGVRVNVIGICQLKVKAFKPAENGSLDVKPDLESLELASRHLLGHDEEYIRDNLRETMEGLQRQIISTLTVEALFQNREQFSGNVRELVVSSLNDLGFDLCSYVVKTVEDDSGYLQSLGETQTAEVKRQAMEGQAKHEAAARRTVATFEAEADTIEAVEKQRAHLAINVYNEQQAMSDRDLNLKRAVFDGEIHRATAEAANAGVIETAKQSQAIVFEETKQKEVLETVKLEIADITVERIQKEREGNSAAEVLAEVNKGKAVTAIAEANAESLTVKGKADADVVREVGQAEATVLRSKAEAFKKFGEAAVVEMVMSKLPEIVENVSAPLGKTDKLVFVAAPGGGDNKSSWMQQLGQLPDAVEGLTGVDIRSAVQNALSGQNESPSHGPSQNSSTTSSTSPNSSPSTAHVPYPVQPVQPVRQEF